MKTKHLLTIVILLTAVLLSVAAPVAAGKEMPVSLNQAEGPTDAGEVEAFMDMMFTRHMEEYHIAGAAVAVVKDGQLFFAKGYGYANVENKIPVDAATTIFRTGSVGKVLTWTAIMQLVEQGKLDLDADINTYLDFQIPDTYPQPITLRHLMTHTSGIEDRWLGSVVTDSSELVSEREWLVDNFPGRVRPPGEAAGYSNYNAMLGGYIVARVSGEPYEEYVQKHIFEPLGMTHSIVQPQMPAEQLPFVRNRAASRPTRAADSILFGISLLNALFLVGIAIWFRPMRPSELHGISLIVEIVMGSGWLGRSDPPPAWIGNHAVVRGIFSPFGAPPSSIEGMIYTVLPVWFHIVNFPEPFSCLCWEPFPRSACCRQQVDEDDRFVQTLTCEHLQCWLITSMSRFAKFAPGLRKLKRKLFLLKITLTKFIKIDNILEN